MQPELQRTPEWYQARLGNVTASRVADVLATTKSGYSASRKNYMAQLVAERLTGQPQDSYSNAAMQWGTEQEPAARAAYEFLTGFSVVETGFVLHPTIAGAGASPDGLVGDDGLVEIKCPNTATHLDTLLAKKADSKYLKQMQWQMACTGREWCDFVSHDPRLPLHLQTFIARVPRDDALIAQMEDEVIKFIYELEQTIAQLEEI